jgi:hypothetical protein
MQGEISSRVFPSAPLPLAPAETREKHSPARHCTPHPLGTLDRPGHLPPATTRPRASPRPKPSQASEPAPHVSSLPPTQPNPTLPPLPLLADHSPSLSTPHRRRRNSSPRPRRSIARARVSARSPPDPPPSRPDSHRGRLLRALSRPSQL